MTLSCTEAGKTVMPSATQPTSLRYLLCTLVLASLVAIAPGPRVAEAQAATAGAPAQAAQPPQFSAAELDELVARIALYPDELLAAALPASTYPLQIVQAARFLEAKQRQPELQPKPEWDTSVLALLNYPEVVNMMNEDLDWTWKLGAAVIAQQQDVIAAIQQFRARTRAAGNLETHDQNVVIVEQEVIRIESADPQVIYVPRYDPQVVVVPQPAAVYPVVSYPPPYPAYYAPGAAFFTGMFVGAAVSYGIGWRQGDIDINRNVNMSNVGNRNVTGGGRQGGSRSTWRPQSRPGDLAGTRPGVRPGAPGTRPGAGVGRPGTRPGVGAGRRPSTQPVTRPGSRPGRDPGARRSAQRSNQGAFSGYQRGRDARNHSQRGTQSRSRSRPTGQASRRQAGGQRAHSGSAFSGHRNGNRSRAHSNRGSRSRSMSRGGGRRGGGRRR
jgi:hypothetical protein